MQKQILDFTRQLALLMKSGVPILKSLEIVAAQIKHKRFSKILNTVISDIQEGDFLSTALERHRCFSPLYINMIKAGEISGNFAPALKGLAEFMVRSKRLKQRVTSAIMYPVLILVTSVMILAVLMVFVLPTFTRIFSDLGGDLPGITVFLILSAEFAGKWGWVFFLFVFLVITGFVLYKRTSRGAFAVNRFLWRLPGIGMFLRDINLERFCRSIGVMMDSGVDIVKAMQATREVLVPPVMKKAVDVMLEDIQEGSGVSQSMEKIEMFPMSLVRIIGVAEESGTLSAAFVETASDYEEEIKMTVSGMLSLLEPLMIIVMGAIIGFIVIGLFMPIFLMGGMM